MKEEATERWYQLCVLAAAENDPAKLLAMVKEINRLLTEKEQSLPERSRVEMRKKWRDIARDTAWKDYGAKTATAAQLLKLASDVTA